MKQQLRLKKTDEIRSVFRLGSRINTTFFTLNYNLNAGPDSRFAAIVGKTFGTAVVRNHAKRKARHLFYLTKEHISPSCDLLFRPRIGMLKEKQSRLLFEFEKSLKLAGVYRGRT